VTLLLLRGSVDKAMSGLGWTNFLNVFRLIEGASPFK
jgi:hypothetical protein